MNRVSRKPKKPYHKSTFYRQRDKFNVEDFYNNQQQTQNREETQDESQRRHSRKRPRTEFGPNDCQRQNRQRCELVLQGQELQPCYDNSMEINSDPEFDNASSSEIVSTWHELDDPLTSSDEEADSLQEERVLSLQEQLADWAKKDVTHQKIGELLCILKEQPGYGFLPKDARTLLKTPRSIELMDIGSGQYWHHGLEDILRSCYHDLTENKTISLQFHVDGLPAAKSSQTQLWPILFRIIEAPDIPPQVIGVYCGESKPENLTEFLKPFVEELMHILHNGIVIKSHRLQIEIHSFICDTPARAYIKGIVNHNHRCGCSKCETEGIFFYEKGHHMSFPDLNAPLRTDSSFRNKCDADHHKEDSLLEQLPIDMVIQFPIADDLHLLHLGVMRKLLYGWTHGNFNFRTKWSSRQIQSISNMLVLSNENMPCEIHRRVRPLNCLKFWKGTEYRTFLLYLGIIILKDNLNEDVYRHFLLLFCATTIYSTEYYRSYFNVAEKMLKEYVEKYKSIYGEDSVSSNIHNLVHMGMDCKIHGPLPILSSAEFEDKLQSIKKMIRMGREPLAQVAKRISEQDIGKKLRSRTENTSKIVLGKNNKILKIGDNVQFKCDEKNNFILNKNDEIIRISSFTSLNGSVRIYGKKICGDYCDFFNIPFLSTFLHVYEIKDFFYGELKLYEVTDIKCKLVRQNYKDNLIFKPLLHTFDVFNKQ